MLFLPDDLLLTDGAGKDSLVTKGLGDFAAVVCLKKPCAGRLRRVSEGGKTTK
jgi:hypothetical protein